MFSGCGGMDLGFLGGFNYRGERYATLPYELVGAFDNDVKCKTTYDLNFQHPLTVCDLGSASVEAFPEADVLIGGFPCQEFSICGPRGGIDSRRGGLFRAMSRYAKARRPSAIVGENVAHLSSINGGADLRTIRASLNRAGYRTKVFPVYAPDYGVPQSRKRIIIVGIRSDIRGDFNLLPPANVPLRSIAWAIDDLKSIADESVPNQSQYFKAGLAPSGHGQGDERNNRSLPAYTIRANSKSRVQFHYELNRRLTVRECARIQTFPDSFIFPNEATPNIRQIGNAVPPLLAHEIARQLADFLTRNLG